MRFILLMMMFFSSGCASAFDMHRLNPPNSREIEAHSLSQYVYRGAELAAKEGAKQYALVIEVNNIGERSIWVYLINDDNDLKELHQKVRNNDVLKLLDIFDTDVNVERRYVPANSVPGLA